MVDSTQSKDKEYQPPCTSCHLLGGTIFSVAGIRNLYHARNAVQHKVWLACSGSALLVAGIIYASYPTFAEGIE